MGRHVAQAQQAAERIAAQVQAARCHATTRGPRHWQCVLPPHPLTPHAHYYQGTDVPDGHHDDDGSDPR